ncbi:MAG: hypothetical protein FWD84_02800 [Oscillospiraceae bacterium]|nr:hypothetical protein [Oscillospiraceae bacterium]
MTKTERFGIKRIAVLALCVLLLAGGTAIAAEQLTRPTVTITIEDGAEIELPDGSRAPEGATVTTVTVEVEDGEELEGTIGFRQTIGEDGTTTSEYSVDDGITWNPLEAE